MIAVRVLLGLAGITMVGSAILSAVKTFVLPRSAPDRITRFVFVNLRALFGLRVRRARSFEERDAIMALYAPIGLLVLLVSYLSLILVGYMGLYAALGVPGWPDAFILSGSSLFTLGFAPIDGVPVMAVAFTESAVGLILVALLIAYLPTMYGAFSRRESAVNLLEVRAGSPPSAVEMIERFHRLRGLDKLTEVWTRWEEWFAEIEESHTSLAALVFFRSPRPQHSWVTAAGAVLDAASLVTSSVNVPVTVEAQTCIRAGYLALRSIADSFEVAYDPNPERGDPISIGREEYDAVIKRLEDRGVPIRPDREQAWLDFAGWRVNYDAVLLALAGLTMAPYAPWSSDRSRFLLSRKRP